MKRTLVRRALFSSLLLAALALLPARSASAQDVSFPDVTGFWAGEFTSDSGATGSTSLAIPIQDQHRFAGTFTFVPPQPLTPPSPCIVLGTASDSGEVTLVGDNEDFILQAHGTVAEGAMLLEYLMLFADGSFDTGTVAIAVETIVPGT